MPKKDERAIGGHAAGQFHRLESPTDKLLKIAEVQSGSYLEEDDIEWLDDDFERL